MDAQTQHINFDCSKNLHTSTGPAAALSVIFAEGIPSSILDVGCGAGLWLKAAQTLGVCDVVGVDANSAAPGQLAIESPFFLRHDLTLPWNLGRRFAAVICLEVAEHLAPEHASALIDALVGHADFVIFSAACPGQPGQHHVNCQWPAYWQKLFNERGYVCSDAVRWRIWSDEQIEPWYRQNLFIARADANQAGIERRIPSVVHPAIHDIILKEQKILTLHAYLKEVRQGKMSLLSYAKTGALIMRNKLFRRF